MSSSEITTSWPNFTEPDQKKNLAENLKHVVALNAYARLLGSKVESLADCMHNLAKHFSIIAETWLQYRSVTDTTIDLAGQHSLDLLTLNRQNWSAIGRQYVGVAVRTRSAWTTTPSTILISA